MRRVQYIERAVIFNGAVALADADDPIIPVRFRRGAGIFSPGIAPLALDLESPIIVLFVVLAEKFFSRFR